MNDWWFFCVATSSVNPPIVSQIRKLLINNLQQNIGHHCMVYTYQEALLIMGNDLVPGVTNKSSNLFASTSNADYITT